MGLNVFNLRLGEILIGISAVFFTYFLVKDLVNFKNLSKEKKNITIIFALIIGSDTLDTTKILSCILVFIGVYLVSLKNKNG